MPLQAVSLTDSTTGATAQVLPGFGLNCYRFCAVCQGRPVEVLWSHPDLPEGNQSPSGSGIPILFPFPGRIRGMTLDWEGRQYPLDLDDGQGNAIHGFVHGRPWRIAEQSSNRLVGRFRASLDAPELLERWPSDFRLQTTYTLDGNTLSAEFEVRNPGDAPLPFGLGVHPYFRLPLGAHGDADACVVRLPVSDAWELDNLVTTGRHTPVPQAQAYQDGVAFGELTLDNVFAGLVGDGRQVVSSIHDPGAGRTLTLRFDRSFRECVAYTPPHREAVCIEPYTCAPDPFRLSAEGVDAGLRVLPPGQVFRTWMRISVE